MARISAGILCYRRGERVLEVLLVHPGGPLWAKKDAGAWTIPKGEVGPGEAPEEAARREFVEETGLALPVGVPLVALAPIRQAGGKLVHAFAVELDVDADAVRSNTFTMEWPPRSGRVQAFPEVDRAGWFHSMRRACRCCRASCLCSTNSPVSLRPDPRRARWRLLVAGLVVVPRVEATSSKATTAVAKTLRVKT